jgi:DNA-binding NtrC family response regulator
MSMSDEQSWPLVLLIEDDQEGADALIPRLTRRHYRVVHVTTSVDAFCWITEQENPLPDAVILDLRLPNGDGVAVIRQIQDAIDERIPVVILTGYGTTDVLREATKLGISGFIHKPMSDIYELLIPLNLGIENARLKRELEGSHDKDVQG